jgi:hypothetical protein
VGFTNHTEDGTSNSTFLTLQGLSFDCFVARLDFFDYIE